MRAANVAEATAAVFGLPLTVWLFAATLLGVLLLHRRALEVAAVGLIGIVLVRMGQDDFSLADHLGREWGKLANLLGLILGFSQIAEHFERSHATDALLRVLPKGARGCFVLLLMVWLVSGVVDNIAAAMIGAAAATRAFKGRLHVGYLAALVACANSGGAGSVLGDTTTTMMWLEGVRPVQVLPAYSGAFVALLVCGGAAAIQQARHAPIDGDRGSLVSVDPVRIAIVLLALVAVVAANIIASRIWGGQADRFPVMALTLWAVIVVAAPARAPRWSAIPAAFKSALFLLALVLAASLMPVQRLPPPTTLTTFGLGLLSSVVDNIPLTKLALDQKGYDWGLLAYAVGVGGSMLWFGSSAGVAISTSFPAARSTVRWVRAGWHVPLAFFLGYAVQLGLHGWHP